MQLKEINNNNILYNIVKVGKFMQIKEVSIEELYRSMSDFMHKHKVICVTSYIETNNFCDTFKLSKKYLCNNASCTEITKILYEECECKTSDLTTVLTSKKFMQIEWYSSVANKKTVLNSTYLIAKIPM